MTWWQFALLLAVLFALAFLMIFRPEWLWKLEHFWSVSPDSRPSDLYLSLTRVGGVLLAVIAFFIAVFSLLRQIP